MQKPLRNQQPDSNQGRAGFSARGGGGTGLEAGQKSIIDTFYPTYELVIAPLTDKKGIK